LFGILEQLVGNGPRTGACLEYLRPTAYARRACGFKCMENCASSMLATAELFHNFLTILPSDKKTNCY